MTDKIQKMAEKLAEVVTGWLDGDYMNLNGDNQECEGLE